MKLFNAEKTLSCILLKKLQGFNKILLNVVFSFVFSINRGSCMSALMVIELLNKLGKRDKM